MKVLFAVSNEEISDAIVKRYQKQYKEIISYKNVYYFNAILKEIQKDKSYDRIVISEELEAFTNTQYDQIDRFIFEKLDSISDEAANSRGDNTPIILICSDRRTKGEEMLVRLFGIGIYDALVGNDRGIEEVCNLIYKPRSKKEAKLYYKVESDEVKYQSENENDVSEQEIQNILAHFKKLGNNEDRYVSSFDNIVAQYNDTQLRIISKFLPLNVRAVLEEKSLKYQQIMSFNNAVTDNIRKNKKKTQDLGPSGKLLRPKNKNVIPSEPIVIPNSVNANNVRKLTRNHIEDNNNGIQGFEEFDNNDFNDILNTNNEEPKKRGRKPKNMNVEETIATPQPKRRGRPRKNPVEEIPQENMNILPGFENRNDFSSQQTQNNYNEENILPGFENNLNTKNNEQDNILNGFEFEDNIFDNKQQNNSFSNNESQYNPFDNNQTQYNPFDNNQTQYNPFDNSQSQYNPFDNNNQTQQYNAFDNNSQKQQYNGFENNNQMQNNDFDDNNASQFNDIFSGNQVEKNEVENNMNSNYTIEPAQNNYEYSNINDNYNQYNGSPLSNISSSNYDMQKEDLSRLLSANKKIATFVGTSKNGTSFIVNNLAEYASSVGINVAILDTTKNKNSYYIYTKNEEELRQIAAKTLENLSNGQATGISVNRNLTVYTSLPEDREELNNVKEILETLVRVHDLVLIDCDFDTPYGYFSNAQEIYLVQSYDILTIQPLTAFLRELKAQNILDQNKIRILLNKHVKVRGISEKTIVGGMSKYNDPAMSFMTDLFDVNIVKYMAIQFEQDIYTRYLESVINCDVSIKGYSKTFMQTLRELNNWVYQALPGNNSYRPQSNSYNNTTFSASMNNTLNQMKRNY